MGTLDALYSITSGGVVPGGVLVTKPPPAWAAAAHGLADQRLQGVGEGAQDEDQHLLEDAAGAVNGAGRGKRKHKMRHAATIALLVAGVRLGLLVVRHLLER